ncbi:hypothetical protein [Pedobacter sp. BMA]|uniref:hypothetical protein n=1 Tax=Pedobacter sp. BMA TaxID=1663685 RepID=UPI0012E061D7|nr:hypothetical protein [Pedobacter sp. BMA]
MKFVSLSRCSGALREVFGKTPCLFGKRSTELREVFGKRSGSGREALGNSPRQHAEKFWTSSGNVLPAIG